MTKILIDLQGTILIYLFCGFTLNKVKLMNESSNRFLSNLLTSFLLPVNVFVSFITSFTFDSLAACITILLLGALFETLIFLFSKVKFKHFSDEQMAVARYDMLVSNGGLIGTPIIESLFGAGGVLYANVFLIPQRIMIYSAGESVFNPVAKKTMEQKINSIYTNKVIIAMLLGLVLVTLNLTLPDFAFSALKNIGKCLSPMSLMLVGSLLAERMHISINDVKKIFVIVLFRQMVFPLFAMGVVLFLPFDFTIKATMVLLLGMPVGATCAVYANKYHGDTRFASLSVFISTLSSMITLVMLMAIMEIILI